MKKLVFIVGVMVLLIGLLIPSAAIADGPVTIDYDDISLSGGFQAGHFPELWDLTECDLVLNFTYDANGLVDDFGGDAHAWAEFGVREYGYGDFNPTWNVEGAGVWLATDYDGNVDTFNGTADDNNNGTPNSGDLDLDDKLILQKAGGHGEGDYNLPSAPPNPWANHRVWWDRDGVDPWQNDETANTGGIYEIEITLNATSPTSGKAYMTIRGLDQGFETDGNWNTIELTPAGMTFTGDMTQMQVFYGLYGYGATHSVAFDDITVTGCLGTVIIDGCDTGVVDQVYDGSTISGKIAECAAEASNHGKFVKCVSHLTNDLVSEGCLTGEEKGKIVSCAAKADIP